MASKEITVANRTFSISYELLNPTATQDIIFLHGWGSNKELMKTSFEKCCNEFRHIYIDMPGFGKSDNNYILKTEDYKLIIEKFLETIHSDMGVIVGHSFGGKVATLLNPNRLILASSSGILVPKSGLVKLKIALFKLLKNIGFGSLYRFFASKDANQMSQNMYETFKNVVDEDFSESFESFHNSALLLWGKDDSATPLYTAYEIQKLIPNSKLIECEGDHYFFLKDKITSKEYIEDFLRGNN